MTENEQAERDEWWWERIRVQRVLDYINSECGTHIVIKERATILYPELDGQLNWDWVCNNTEDEEIAIEVKRLTDEKVEIRQKEIRNILDEIKEELLNKLPGSFLLGISIDRRSTNPPLRGPNKQKFKDTLCEAIYQTAQTLGSETEQPITPQIKEQLPFVLSDTFFCELRKLNNEGSALYISSGVPGDWPFKLNERELEGFERTVSHANEQLKVAKNGFNAKETILMIIEEGYRLTHPDTILGAFKSIDSKNYSDIDRAYSITGNEITEIPIKA